MKSKLFTFFILLCFAQWVSAANVDTVNIYSTVMQKNIKAVIITPDNYSKQQQLPVVYLLHGYGDNYAGWVTKGSGTEKLADTYGVIIVCPDGSTSWYFDSPVDNKYQYETYIIKELVPWVDKNYATIADRSGRGITGLSMGGHGALYLAFRHQDVFGVAGSMSGGVDFRPFPNNWNLSNLLGKYSMQADNWGKYTVINMLHLLTPKSLPLIIDCGTDDFFYKVNCQLHEQLLYRNIPHDFIIRPGVHNWEYWRNAVQYQLLFMNNYFKKVS